MKIPGPPVGFTDLMDYAQTQKYQEFVDDPKKKFNPLRPSAAGYCARRLAYATSEFRGLSTYDQPTREPATTRLLDLGYSVEYHSLKNLSLLEHFDVRYKGHSVELFPIKRGGKIKNEICEGKLDAVMYSEKYKAILDVKSKKDKFSAVYKTGWEEELAKLHDMEHTASISPTAIYITNLSKFIEELGDDFLADNLYQLNAYAYSAFMRKRVKFAFLYRYCKNDSRHMEIRFTPSKKVFDYVKKKFNDVSLKVDKGEINNVEKEWYLGSSRCAFCPYSSVCWGDVDALKEWFHTFPRKRWPKDIDGASQLGRLFTEYADRESASEKQKTLENAITKIMVEQKLTKVKLEDGKVYEAKFLKTPWPHVSLRRSKL